MVVNLLDTGLTLDDIKGLTQNEYIMIMSTKLAIKEKQEEAMQSAQRANAAKPAQVPRGRLY